jgi:hypothetical protein
MPERHTGRMNVQTFRTVLEPMGGNNVAIVVPDEVVAAFEHGKRVPVAVTVDGDYTYANTIASMGGRFLISFNAATRAATGRGAGDEIEVRLELDDAPRTVAPPPELAAALETDAAASAAWDALSYTRKKQHAQALESARTEVTRERRLVKVLESLRG